jgi:hypothetical protein
MRLTRLSANPLDGTLRLKPQVSTVSCMAQDLSPDHSTPQVITTQLEIRVCVWLHLEDFHRSLDCTGRDPPALWRAEEFPVANRRWRGQNPVP